MVGASDPCADRPTPRAVARVLELIGEGFVSVDAQWRFTYVNGHAERIYKTQRERMLGNNIWEMFPAALGTAFEREYRRVMAERVEGRVEAPFPRLNGWMEVKIYPLDDGGLALYFTDIAQRRRAEKHLDCQKKLQELIFAGASLASLLTVLAQAMESISIHPAQVSILVMDDDTGWLRHAAAPRLPASFNDAVDAVPAAVDAVPWAVAAHAKRAVTVENIAEHPLLAFRNLALSCDLRASWTTPIMLPRGGVLGTFSLLYRDCVRPSQMEAESAVIFANLAGLLISHTRMVDAAAKRPPPLELLRKA